MSQTVINREIVSKFRQTLRRFCIIKSKPGSLFIDTLNEINQTLVFVKKIETQIYTTINSKQFNGLLKSLTDHS